MVRGDANARPASDIARPARPRGRPLCGWRWFEFDVLRLLPIQGLL
jgi:hypothetical protein